jgi:hypothetical protein
MSPAIPFSWTASAFVAALFNAEAGDDLIGLKVGPHTSDTMRASFGICVSTGGSLVPADVEINPLSTAARRQAQHARVRQFADDARARLSVSRFARPAR